MYACVKFYMQRLGQSHFLQYSKTDTRWRPQPIGCCHSVPASRQTDEKTR